MPNFSGIWTVTQQMQAKGASTWPAPPGAPTIGTATGANASASVAFTAPACTGYPAGGITGYQAVSTPGCFTTTGAASPLTVTGLTNGTPYTFKVRATNANGYGPLSAASNSVTPAVIGQQAYTCAGTFSWVAPAGVTSVSVIAVGAGGIGGPRISCCGTRFPGSGGGGGGLGYKNNYSVTPGNSYTVFVGAPQNCAGTTGDAYFVATNVVRGGGGKGDSGGVRTPAGGTFTGCGGGNGGNGFGLNYCGVTQGGGGAGGAGGYSSNGANATIAAGAAGTGGSGGSGGSGTNGTRGGGGGGGVGILGSGANGTAGASNGGGGGGGSGGANGASSTSTPGVVGGSYGGGGGGSSVCSTLRATGGLAAVRIIWPGTSRTFPSTCTGNL